MVRLRRAEDENISETLVRHGFMPTAPLHPESAIALDVLEIFFVLSAQCPALSRMAFVKGICALQHVSSFDYNREM